MHASTILRALRSEIFRDAQRTLDHKSVAPGQPCQTTNVYKQ